MGSLVPGWSSVSNNLPPKDLTSSFDEEEEPKGYFAKLEKRRSLRRRSAEQAPDLQRRSAPLSPGSPRAGDSLFGQPSSPVEMRRSTEWGGSDSLEVGSAPISSSRHIKNQKSSTSVPKDGYRWWKKLSSGFLNEMYEDEHLGKDKSTSFTPQYTVTGQKFNYRLEDKQADAPNDSDAPKDMDAPKDQDMNEADLLLGA